jgi:D-amino-acid dehydrogenase
MAIRVDVVVLGAGMVGVSVALHLEQRGRDVVLVDRRGPGEETSYGNSGLIQGEEVIPYTFPRELGTILSYAMNHRRDAGLPLVGVAAHRAVAVSLLAERGTGAH